MNNLLETYIRIMYLWFLFNLKYRKEKFMEDFIERLIDEKNEVSGRAAKLEVFVDTDKFKEIDSEQQMLLRIQLKSMHTYIQCLHERLVLLQK